MMMGHTMGTTQEQGQEQGPRAVQPGGACYRYKQPTVHSAKEQEWQGPAHPTWSSEVLNRVVRAPASAGMTE